MNENHPDFIGPRLPPASAMRERIRRLIPPALEQWRGLQNAPLPRISIPKDIDLNRPIGVSPAEWAAMKAKRDQKPAGVRADDRHRWKPGARLAAEVPMSPGFGEYAVAMADKVITGMLSGKLPKGAGSNTAAVSNGFNEIHVRNQVGMRANVYVMLPRMSGPLPVVPFKSGLHELRRARGRRI